MKIGVDHNKLFNLMKTEAKIREDTKYPKHPNKISW